MTAPVRLLVAGQPLDPAAGLPPEAWSTADGAPSLLPGLASVGGRLVVVLPRCYAGAPLDPGAALERVALFVSSLARYARERPGGRAVDDPALATREGALVAVGDPGDLVDQVEAALLLWRDFVERGPLLVSAPRVHDQVPGRVLWPQALRDGAPVQGRTGVVFRALPRRSVRPDPRHELTDLHEATCEQIGARFGLGGAGERPPIPPTEALDRIERGERVCFADRPRRLLALLRRYHAAREASERGAEVRGLFARSYAHVWERMLQVALRDEGRGAGLRGTYRLPDGSLLPGLNLRPDVVVRDRLPDGRAVLLVLDAKDYDAGALPGTPDLGKQVLYRLLHSDLVDPQGPPLDAVGNAFLFPALVPGAGVRLRATHDLVGRPRAGRPGRVVGLEVDLEQVTEAYVSGRAAEGLRRAIVTAVFGGA
ncbi:MAG: LlaJI family restriction endonuclease [Planctomycetes bacterium]|nr:LlaJI family restriction endonuclease [Planctomycetota bacterium]